MPFPVITIKSIIHHDKPQIGLYFTYDKMLIAHTRKIEGMLWSPSIKCWYIFNTYSGFEERAKLALLDRIKNAKQDEFFGEILNHNLQLCWN